MPARNLHHALSTHEVLLLLETDPHAGLSGVEAAARLRRFGPNVLPPADVAGPVRRFGRQLRHPLIYVLIVAGWLTLLLGELVEAGVIFGVVLVNATVGFLQESKAEAELDALRSIVRTEARVRRDGALRKVASDAVVPGDMLVIEAGDKVPADARVIESSELQVDESALTGESMPVAKDEAIVTETMSVADRQNMIYAGTLVTGGTASSVVVATGAETELGEIHRLVGSADRLATPLTRKLGWFSKLLTAVILALAAVTFGVGMLRGEPATEMLTASVALAVGAIPEGLPAAVTVTLAIGVNRMARRRAVVRRLPAVETLGSTTVICSDKTGTLTENQMTVRTVWTPHGQYEVTGSGYSPEGMIVGRDDAPAHLDADAALRWTLLTGMACNDARLTNDDGSWAVTGDPTEGAMLVVAAKGGLSPDRVATMLPRIAMIPFNSDRKFMATQHEVVDGDATVILAKGAVESILGLCAQQLAPDGSVEPLEFDRVMAGADGLARQGLRVLATARSDAAGALCADALPRSMAFTGLLAMVDPPRPAAIAAVARCRAAGIDVKMITGDHVATATAIAGRLGILTNHDPGRVLTGTDLAELGVDAWAAAAEHASVFARVSPEQKLRLVERLQDRHHIVAMTGDGVNDAPALQQADIGIAMGFGGTEVAKEASDMVLMDDDFATIEAAVEEGRGVFDNLTKFIVWTLPTNMGEGLVILTAILVGAALPILPVQILWINMTTAVALGLTLAFEPKERGIMQRPPRDPRRPLLTSSLLARILLVSAMLVGGSWWLFEWERSSGATIDEARTAALNLFVAVEAFYLLNCRTLTRSMWHVGVFSNPWIMGGISVQAVGQLAITYVPFMNAAFATAPIGADAWLRILALATAASLVVAIDKRLHRQGV